MGTSSKAQHPRSKLQTSQHGIDKNLRFLAAIVQSSEDAIMAETLDGIITIWNPAAERMFGYTIKEAVGKPLSIITTPNLAGELKIIIEKVRKGIKIERYETQRKRKDGTLLDVAVTASPVRDDSGKLLGISLIDRDNTLQKQASQYARSLIEASLDPLVTISSEGKITDVNEATVKVTGVPREKLVGTNFASYFTESDKAQEGYKLVLARGFVTDYPLTIRHKDGALTDVLYNASVYRDTTGQVLGVFAAARDITMQKKAEVQLAEQRARELERLAELERFQRLTVGRELKMIELKKEIEDLKKRLGESG